MSKKKRIPFLYKGGVDTKIANKHFFHFSKRFNEENASVLKEAREEMDRIYAEKRKNRIRNVIGQRMSNLINKNDKNEFYRQNKHLRDISKEQ